MKRLLIVASLLCNVAFAQDLPKSIDVYFSKYFESQNYSRVPLDSALANPDTQTIEDTDCHYVMDFEHMEVRVYYANKLTGKATIISAQYVVPQYKTEFDVWEYFVKLQDGANETEIRISTESNAFLYTYAYDLEGGYYERNITFPTKPIIVVND
jgi:hypothetical protein